MKYIPSLAKGYKPIHANVTAWIDQSGYAPKTDAGNLASTILYHALLHGCKTAEQCKRYVNDNGGLPAFDCYL